MPEPLVCEDTSLTRLMETVNKTPGARILYQDTVRRGGVLGFFAREVHRVAYLVGESDVLGESDVVGGSEPTDEAAGELPDPISSLLASADAAEARLRTPAQHDSTDFASMLRRCVAEEEPAESPKPEPSVDKPIADVTPLGSRGRDARTRLELLMQLRQVGVPISLNPSGTVHSPYEALEDILEQLPAPAELPSGAGQLIVLAGEAAPTVRAARTVSKMLRLRLGSIVIAGVDGGIGGALRRISSPQEAALLRAELTQAATPSVLVIATDSAGLGPDDPWPAAMIQALRPATVWGVVDARWKVEDCRTQLVRLPRTDALAVHSAELSVSPASVWELDLPIGLLDDRRPSSFIWLGMLIRLLGGAPRHRASA